MTTNRIAQTHSLAVQYAQLARDGRLAEADQIASTIDELIGRWNDRCFLWPRSIAEAAGVDPVRRRL